MNENCYKLSEIKSNYGELDKCIDVTYIIHLEDDHSRLLNIIQQFDKYIPTKLTYILFNKGYKKCNKNQINSSAKDLIDSYLYIFKDAKNKNYNNILILEDDFIFNKSICSKKVNKNISLFVNKLKNSFIYYLGCIPYMQIPVNVHHNKLFIAGSTHACIYSKKIREKILKIDKDNIIDWDIFLNSWNYNNNDYIYRYTYWKPLCYQLYPTTENSINEKQIPIITNFKNTIKKNFFKMDKYPEPGFSIFYYFSNMVYLIILLLFYFLFNPIVFSKFN
jgi:hypothetical protein